jgi:hypothetical protein
VFGACYTLFFLFLGAGSVAQGALLGKIIPAAYRGRAMAMGMGLSGVINMGAILLVFNLMRSGAFPEPRNYALAFTLTLAFFILAGLALLAVREAPSPTEARTLNPLANLKYVTRLARENENLRVMLGVQLSIGVLIGMLQFYTGYWRQAGTLTAQALVLATVFQVFWQSLSSAVFGRIADRRGNRGIICSLLWIEAFIPLVALVLGGIEPFRSHWGWYIGVYTLIGIRFPVYQLLVNYLLEIVPPRDQATALGAMNSVQLLTAPAPLLLGIIAATLGYPVAFVLGSAVGVAGALLAGRLREVRSLAAA